MKVAPYARVSTVDKEQNRLRAGVPADRNLYITSCARSYINIVPDFRALINRYREKEGTAFTYLAFQPDIPSVKLDQ